MMKKEIEKKNKNNMIIALCLLALLVIAGIVSFKPMLHVKAQGILTGLESKVSKKVLDSDTFTILEVIPDESSGEIEDLVKDQNISFLQSKIDTYLTDYLAEDSSHKNTPAIRNAYVASLENQLTDYIGDEKPFSKEQNFEEEYFVSDSDSWNVMEFSKGNYETAQLKGDYAIDNNLNGNYQPNFSKVEASSNGYYKVNFSETKRTDTEDALYQQAYQKIGTDEYRVAPDGAAGTLYYISECTYVGEGSAEGRYIPVLDTELPYLYVKENGIYCFKEDEAKTEKTVQIGKIYYKGGIESNDWMRTKILSSAKSSQLDIEVKTVTESELLSSYDISDVDFIYLCADTTNSGKIYQKPQDVWNIVKPLVDAKIPCIIDTQTGIQTACGDYTDTYANQTDFVNGSLYIMQSKTGENRQPLYADMNDVISDTSGLSEVSKFIKKDNQLRSGAEKLSEVLNRIFLIQYIIDYSNQRSVGTKDEFHILQIQPGSTASADTNSFMLSHLNITKWAGVSDELVSKVTIDTMSMAEFIGKVNDLNEDYDLIYFGASIDCFNTIDVSESSKKTVYNDSQMNGLIYTHTGDYVLGQANITGSLDTDYGGAYYFRNSETKPYAKNNNYLLYNNDDAGLYSFLYNRTKRVDGVLIQTLKNISQRTYYDYFAPITNHQDVYGDLGVYRYSGNDITKTKMQDVLEYVQANYPVVVSDSLYHTDTDGNKTVNTDTVDNTSYIYQMLEQMKDNENVFTAKQAESGNSEIGIYLNLPKPQIQYYDLDTPDKLEVYEAATVSAGNEFSDDSKMRIDTTNSSATGTYTAKLGFYLDSKKEASESTIYIPEFYLDLNADGKFLESGTNGSSEKITDCIIYNYETGEEATKDGDGNYQLSSGVHYLLEREIPSSYLGVLTWKLEVSQAENSYIRTSDVQYTKVNGTGTEEMVKVLQITSNDGSTDTTTISLSANSSAKGYDAALQNYLTEIRRTTGLNFQITTIDGYRFGRKPADSAQAFYNSYLSDYDMIIVGFGDMYCDISNNNYALDAINLFIDSGKSVLFSHDVISFINVSPDHSFDDINLSVLGFNEIDQKHWGYYMNQAFRSVLAMDRYGIEADTTDTHELKEQSQLLKQGQHLTVSTNTLQAAVNQCEVHKYRNSAFPITGGGTDIGNFMGDFLTRGISRGTLSSNRDIAYAAKTYNSIDQTAQVYGQTQGYTNALLNNYLVVTGYTQNNGNPYLNQKNSLMKSGTNASGKTAAKVTSVNNGLITHYPYEIGDSFTSATTHFPYYQLNLDQDSDGDGEGDVVVWYCLSGDATDSTSNANKVYTNPTNDVRNNYYIYNIGNVTYTGLGHTALNHSGADLEAKLFVNTIVAAYKAVVQSPGIKILESADRTSDEKQYEYITYDDAVNGKAVNSDISFYFTVSDPNMTASQKNLTMEFAYYDSNNQRQVLDASQVSVTDVTEGTAVSGSYTTSHIYQATLSGLTNIMAGVEQAKFEAQVTCSFNYYGKTEIHHAAKELTVLKTSLFPLN